MVDLDAVADSAIGIAERDLDGVAGPSGEQAQTVAAVRWLRTAPGPSARSASQRSDRVHAAVQAAQPAALDPRGDGPWSEARGAS